MTPIQIGYGIGILLGIGLGMAIMLFIVWKLGFFKSTANGGKTN